MREDLRPIATELLARASGSRGALKRAAKEIERDADLRAAVVAVAQGRGVDVDPTADAKRLLRQCLDRSDAAQVRRNPIALDEAFTCSACGHDVSPHGRTARDHCPRCLCSLHVDVVPGDRAADCGGILRPVSAERRGDDWHLTYRCDACGAQRKNRAILDGADSDDLDVIARLHHS